MQTIITYPYYFWHINNYFSKECAIIFLSFLNVLRLYYTCITTDHTDVNIL